MTANIEFDEEIDPRLYLKQFNIMRSNSTSNKLEIASKASFDATNYRFEEGRSVFYLENSQDECSQQPSTSRFFIFFLFSTIETIF